MSINIGPPEVDELRPRIAVIGVGGAGGNAIANMIAAQVEGVEFAVCNTDAQALNASPADIRIQLGPDITQGLGAGSRPEVGRAAAEETIGTVEDALEGAHMCFIAAGMGGGTGTGAAPVIAKAARDKGILTVGVVTKPFTFEGSRRMRAADAGIQELQQNVDTLIVIPNQNLFLVANPNTTFKEAFSMADEVLQQGVRGITDLMVMPGLINLDFADVRSVMHEMGKAMMGTGEAEGDNRALEAAEKAIANPLLDGVSMKGARGVIISITGGEDMRLMEVDEAANHIRELVDPDANIIWGSAFNDGLEGKIRVSVVATGIDADADAERPPVSHAFSLGGRGTAQAAPTSRDQGFASAPQSDAPDQMEPLDLSEEEAEAEPLSYDSHDEATSDEAVGASAYREPQAYEPEPEQYSPSPEEDQPTTGADDPFELSEPVGVEPPVEAPEGYPVDEDGNDAVEEPRAAMSIRDRLQDLQRQASASAAADDGRDTGLDDDDEAPPQPAPEPREERQGGGTLFERMSRLSRGSRGEANDGDSGGDDDDTPGIPRFLNRQNNQ